MPAFWKKRKTTGPTQLQAKTLGLAITAAVRKSNPLCENFIGVWIEAGAQTSRGGTSWSVKGIQFGKADREYCGPALATIVERMQKKYELKLNGSKDNPKR
jgi:hypothetical protein